MKSLIIAAVLALNLLAAVGEGDRAPDFTLKSLDGAKRYSMADFKGEVVLLNLWASWCDGCKKEMPEFFELQKAYGSGFKIVAVGIDNESNASRKFLESLEADLQYKTPFVALYDPEKSLPKAYGAMGMPSSYLIDKNGVVRQVIIGSLDKDGISELKHAIDALR